jgi:hypothetical protein
VLEQDVEGKVRLFGQGLRAAYNLAKNIAKLVDRDFGDS